MGHCALPGPYHARGFCTAPCEEDEDCPPGSCGLADCVASCSLVFDGRAYCGYERRGPLGGF